MATLTGARLLALNAGSSSTRFALFRVDEHGQFEPLHAGRFDGAAPTGALLEQLAQQHALDDVAAVGHRIVHGMRHAEPVLLDAALRAELHRYVALAPVHLPPALDLIDAIARRFPRLPQVGCFDTAFHRDLPRVAQLLPLPRRFEALGVRRYGFHGLSCEFLMAELARRAGTLAQGRVILAHLGSGASITAVAAGRSVDTSMGFTPNSGVPMGTRSGDLEPGLVGYLARAAGFDAEQFDSMTNHEAGLLGVSGTSSDMRELLALEATDPRAAEAVALFCTQVKKWIGAMAAVLGGVDALVFSGGIGEHSHVIRARICAGLEHLGIALSGPANAAAAPVISAATAAVPVHVIATDEQRVIAAATWRALQRE